MQPPAKGATPSIFLYTRQVLYTIPYVGVGERLEVVVACSGTLSDVRGEVGASLIYCISYQLYIYYSVVHTDHVWSCLAATHQLSIT